MPTFWAIPEKSPLMENSPFGARPLVFKRAQCPQPAAVVHTHTSLASSKVSLGGSGGGRLGPQALLVGRSTTQRAG